MGRKNDRKPVDMRADFRASGDQVIVVLSDISVKGCRITVSGIPLTPNQNVVLRPDGLEHLTGTVRWAMGCFAGIEFDLPLDSSVVEYLCRLHPDHNGRVTLELAA